MTLNKIRTKWVPIRTLSLIPVQIKITMDEDIPLYRKIAPKVRELKVLGMTNVEIAAKLQINRRTVWKAIRND